MDVDWTKFEDYTRQIMHENNILGAAVAVSKAGETIYRRGFGVRDEETQKPVTASTIFGIASVTKSFTALVVNQLAEEGELDLEDPVVEYLPELDFKDEENMEEIKIFHLLSHTSGLPPLKRRQDIKSFDEHIRYISEAGFEMLGRPGEYFSYSNDGFLLLGAVIERLTDKLYRRVLTQRLLERLEMNRSTLSLEEIEKFSNVSVPYIYDEDEGTFEEASWPALGTYEVGGGVRSNVLDLLHYGQVYVNDGLFKGKRFVGKQTVRRMWCPIHKIDRNSHYGQTLKVTPYQNVTLVEHGGGQPGVSSNFGFVPEEDLVVAVLTNVSGVPAASLWLAAANTVLGLPLETKRSREPEHEMSDQEMNRFLGIYKSKEGGKIRVFRRDEKVVIETHQGEFKVRASDARSLVMRDKPRRNVVRFFFDDQGEPWAAFYGLRMLPKVPQVV